MIITKKQRFTIGFRAGLIGGILASVFMLLFSLLAGIVSLPEALGAAIAQAMPLSLFEYLHGIIGDNAKYYLLYIIVAGQCLAFALSGGLWNILTDARQKEDWSDEQGLVNWRGGVALSFVLWLFSGLIFLPLTGAGIFGAQLPMGMVNTGLSLAVVGAIFAILYTLAQNWLTLRQLKQNGQEASGADDSALLKRRSLISGGLTILGLGALGVVAWRFISGASGGSSTPTAALNNYKAKVTPPTPNYGTLPNNALSPEITPIEEFYQVSKNFVSDPNVNASGWQLTVDGLVNSPYTLNYQQLLAEPMQTQYETLMCISNEVGGHYMGNAKWEGVQLAHLLQKAGGVKGGAIKVVLHAADDYTDSIHLDKALEPTTVVAVKMDDTTLPQEHGYPARLLVPGIYGMKHVKWITRIEVVNTDYQGYWQQNGWSDPAPVRMTARIDTPFTGNVLHANKLTYIAGVAFSGNKGISEVDVSFDGGQNWQQATLKKPLSNLTWVLWEIPWQPSAGNYNVTVRAIDLQGNVQSPENAPPLPDGSSGYHNINVIVS